MHRLAASEGTTDFYNCKPVTGMWHGTPGALCSTATVPMDLLPSCRRQSIHTLAVRGKTQ